MTPLAEIGRLLREERKRQGMTQDAMAACAGVTRGAVAMLEKPCDRRSPNTRTVDRYAASLGCRIEVRLVREGEDG